MWLLVSKMCRRMAGVNRNAGSGDMGDIIEEES